MKLFMLWDMEGVSGIHSREQVWFWEEGVRQEVAAEGRRLLMADINSAAAAALEAGVEELIICDTHGGGGNIVMDQMLADPRITYLGKSRGYQDGKLRWMPGLDETVDGFLVPGHHAMAGTPGAFLPHTWSLEWADFRLNGQSVGEMGIEACFAGHWDIPAIFAQSDTAACRRADVKFSRRCMYAYTSRASRVPLSRRPVTPGLLGIRPIQARALAAGPQRPR